MTLWLSILGALLFGAALGGVGALVILRRQYGDQDTVRSLQRELEAYRREVAEHYAETAKRVDNLTQAYKSVHDHLEDGAYRLVGEEELRRRLQNATSDPVTLDGIGPRELRHPPDPGEGDRTDQERPRDAAGVAGSQDVEAGGARGAAAPAAPESAGDEDIGRGRDAGPSAANEPGNGAPGGTQAEPTRGRSHAESPAERERAGSNGDGTPDARAGGEGGEPERPRAQDDPAASTQEEPTSPREPRARS